MTLYDEAFLQYILTSTYANFDQGFDAGQHTVFKNKILVDRKLNSLGILADTEIKRFSDISLEKKNLN